MSDDHTGTLVYQLTQRHGEMEITPLEDDELCRTGRYLICRDLERFIVDIYMTSMWQDRIHIWLRVTSDHDGALLGQLETCVSVDEDLKSRGVRGHNTHRGIPVSKFVALMQEAIAQRATRANKQEQGSGEE